MKKAIVIIVTIILLFNNSSYAQDDAKARLNVFWKLVGMKKDQNQLPKTIDDFIYGVISNKYPNLPLSEVMVRIETIDKYPAIQNDVLKRVYDTYAKGDAGFLKLSLETIFGDMCGNSVMANWVADYTIKKYSTSTSISKTQVNQKLKDDNHKHILKTLQEIADLNAWKADDITTKFNQVNYGWKYLCNNGDSYIWSPPDRKGVLRFTPKEITWNYSFINIENWKQINKDINDGGFQLDSTDDDGFGHIVKTFSNNYYIIKTTQWNRGSYWVDVSNTYKVQNNILPNIPNDHIAEIKNIALKFVNYIQCLDAFDIHKNGKTGISILTGRMPRSVNDECVDTLVLSDYSQQNTWGNEYANLYLKIKSNNQKDWKVIAYVIIPSHSNEALKWNNIEVPMNIKYLDSVINNYGAFEITTNSDLERRDDEKREILAKKRQAAANEEEKVIAEENPEILTNAQQMPAPSFDMAAYLEKNLQYPEADAQHESNTEKKVGRVTLKFVVNEDGSITDIQVVSSMKGGYDDEAIKVVLAMPKWKPGKQNGKPIKVYYNLPIDFKSK